MEWRTPKLVEIACGCEINAYFPADLCAATPGGASVFRGRHPAACRPRRDGGGFTAPEGHILSA